MSELITIAAQTPPAPLSLGALSAENIRLKWSPMLSLSHSPSGERALLGPNDNLDVAVNWHKVIPSDAELAEAQQVFEEAISQRCPRELELQLFSFMIDAFPKPPPNIAVYLRALEIAVQGQPVNFSHHVIASAVLDVITQCRFMPSVSEVLASLREARGRFLDAHRRINHLRAMRGSAERLLAAHGIDG
jgi:hypothetical protein